MAPRAGGAMRTRQDELMLAGHAPADILSIAILRHTIFCRLRDFCTFISTRFFSYAGMMQTFAQGRPCATYLARFGPAHDREMPSAPPGTYHRYVRSPRFTLLTESRHAGRLIGRRAGRVEQARDLRHIEVTVMYFISRLQ